MMAILISGSGYYEAPVNTLYWDLLQQDNKSV